jgi:hypothetical protein
MLTWIICRTNPDQDLLYIYITKGYKIQKIHGKTMSLSSPNTKDGIPDHIPENQGILILSNIGNRMTFSASRFGKKIATDVELKLSHGRVTNSACFDYRLTHGICQVSL